MQISTFITHKKKKSLKNAHNYVFNHDIILFYILSFFFQQSAGTAAKTVGLVYLLTHVDVLLIGLVLLVVSVSQRKRSTNFITLFY